jgi:hypothetical protein
MEDMNDLYGVLLACNYIMLSYPFHKNSYIRTALKTVEEKDATKYLFVRDGLQSVHAYMKKTFTVKLNEKTIGWDEILKV